MSCSGIAEFAGLENDRLEIGGLGFGELKFGGLENDRQEFGVYALVDENTTCSVTGK